MSEHKKFWLVEVIKWGVEHPGAAIVIAAFVLALIDVGLQHL